MKSTDIFNHIRPKIGVSEKQKDALYELINQGAKIETIAEFVGLIKGDEVINKDQDKSEFSLSQISIDRLSGVHPDLVKVVKRAIEISPIDFMVVQGLRTKEQAWENWGKGRTAAQLKAKGVPVKYAKPNESKVTWLSNPLSSNHMTGNAVDLAPVPYAKYKDDIDRHKIMAESVKKAAIELGVKIEWGGDWKSAKDYPHFEIA